MTRAQTLTILGGGSVWTPHLLDLMSTSSERLNVRLYGPTGEHLREVAAFSVGSGRTGLAVSVHEDLVEALTEADVILNQARVGGLAARREDEFRAARLGGLADESLGVGGLRAAVRTWPFLATLAEAVRQAAPAAWLINLTNPADLTAMALRHFGCRRVISLCDHPQKSAREVAAWLGDPARWCDFAFLGLMHVGWLIPPPGLDIGPLLDHRPELAPWVERWQAVPTDWRIWQATWRASPQVQDRGGTRAGRLLELAADLRGALRAGDRLRYRALLAGRPPTWYGDVVVPAVRSLLGGPPSRLVVGLPNASRIDDMDPAVPLEMWTRLDGEGAHPEGTPFPTSCRVDVASFGRTRRLAFDFLVNRSLETLAPYLAADGFAPPAASVAVVLASLDDRFG